MTRVYLVMASVAVLLMCGNLALGLISGDIGAESRRLIEAHREVVRLQRTPGIQNQQLQMARQRLRSAEQAYRPFHRRKTLHIWCGVVSALLVTLVSIFGLTYFIGAGRWCREVVISRKLDPGVVESSTRLKRRALPWALGAPGVILLQISLGALSDPVANFEGAGSWVDVHLGFSVLAIGTISWGFWVQLSCIRLHSEIVGQIMTVVRAETDS